MRAAIADDVTALRAQARAGVRARQRAQQRISTIAHAGPHHLSGRVAR